MIAEDLQACLHAYQFAELLLGGFLTKSSKARTEAVEAAETLRDDVAARHQQVLVSERYSEAQVAALSRLKARLDERLAEAKLLLDGAGR